MTHNAWMAPDQMASIGSYVARNWGDHGYRIAVLGNHPDGGVIVEVLASDGSRFRLRGDRWSNVEQLCEQPDPGSPLWSSGTSCLKAGKYRIPRSRVLCDDHFQERVDEQIRAEATR